MTTYTYSQARQNFASVLNNAKRDGNVIIKRKDGSLFIIKPIESQSSPLNVKGVRAKVSTTDIVSAVRDGREK